jgi:proteasome lid subunit RPN8/RPN11
VADLHLADELLARLLAACEREYPREACGLLLGVDGAGRSVRRVVPARNLAERRGRFVLCPADFIRADSEGREDGFEIVGVFHSHPDEEARPSAEDLASAQPGWSHVIVPVRGDGRAGTARSWRLAGGGERRLVEESLRATNVMDG